MTLIDKVWSYSVSLWQGAAWSSYAVSGKVLAGLREQLEELEALYDHILDYEYES